jgi:hypothetical protein
MRGLEIPEHLELLLTGGPVLDIYAAGLWRVNWPALSWTAQIQRSVRC